MYSTRNFMNHKQPFFVMNNKNDIIWITYRPKAPKPEG